MQHSLFRTFATVISMAFAATVVAAQDVVRELKLAPGASIEIVNRSGRVAVIAESGDDVVSKLVATSPKALSETELKITSSGGRAVIVIVPADPKKRIDVVVTVPERVSINVETRDGAVEVSGNIASVNAKTEIGTITLDVPSDEIKYSLKWTESRPRYVADFDLEDIKERSGGRFEIKGTHRGEAVLRTEKPVPDTESGAEVSDVKSNPKDKKVKLNRERSGTIVLDLTTARGIVLINVPPNEVGSDLRERPLTNAAKAIVRSGDSLLMEAIRRAAPKYYGDYARSLPPLKKEPEFAAKREMPDVAAAETHSALVRVTGLDNRAIAGLGVKDFDVTEGGVSRQVLGVTQSTAPFNLVLLLDVSGSVENYVNFIRKAARAFVETVDKNDRVAIITFNDDSKVLSKFTTDRGRLSESLDTFDAGGGTAFYDALAFTVADTLRPLKGERTAIVILTDGEDNRSFLAFDSLMGSIQESGALIYPLYVPSGLIAAAASGQNADIDPMRKKYMSLSAKSQGEGERLAKVSGGVYYPISQISQIQKAYEDIVIQLRTAYIVTYRSDSAAGNYPRLKIKAKRENTYVTINSVGNK
ncbi:MAG: VWA domain-containing protein [Chloracidobacterium sp.]|nr:VWA domain-containing protein [Chloracidobacterium sp.]